jgi:hypothetical protein
VSYVLSVGNEVFFRSNFKSMIKQSRGEFVQWKNNRNIVFFQQACEKLYNALEQLVEIKSKLKLESHDEFRSAFRRLKFPSVVLRDADDLHRFFYNGEAFEKDLNIIEGEYLVVYGFLLKQKV